MAESEVQEKALAVVDGAARLTVTSQETFERAALYLREIKAVADQIKTFFLPLKQKAQDAHKSIVAAEKEQLAPLVSAEGAIKAQMAEWEQEERERIEQERIAAEAAAVARAESELLDEAAALEAAGEREAAEAVLAEAENPVAVVVPIREAPKAAGVSFRNVFRVEVVDLRALADAVANGVVAEQALTPNTTFLSALARSTGGAVRIPGVRVYVERSVAARAR